VGEREDQGGQGGEDGNRYEGAGVNKLQKIKDGGYLSPSTETIKPPGPVYVPITGVVRVR
jgi:hypothetical protein